MQKLLAIAFVVPALYLGTPASAYTQEEQIACQGMPIDSASTPFPTNSASRPASSRTSGA